LDAPDELRFAVAPVPFRAEADDFARDGRLRDGPLEPVFGAEPLEARLVCRLPDVDLLLVAAITHPSVEEALPVGSVPAISGAITGA
jgi:hypothetical protein